MNKKHKLISLAQVEKQNFTKQELKVLDEEDEKLFEEWPMEAQNEITKEIKKARKKIKLTQEWLRMAKRI